MEAKVWRVPYPRLTYKTTLISALCLYAFLKDENIRIVLGRATTQLSQATLYGIKLACTHPSVRAAFGDIEKRFAKWTDEFIVLADRTYAEREPTIDTTGLNTSKTGAHPDFVILDDLVNETNLESPLLRWREQDGLSRRSSPSLSGGGLCCLSEPGGAITMCTAGSWRTTTNWKSGASP